MKTFECRICSGGCRVERHGYDEDVIPDYCVRDASMAEWQEVKNREESASTSANTGSPKLLNSLQSSLSLVKNGMSSEEIHRVRGVIADAIDQLRAGA